MTVVISGQFRLPVERLEEARPVMERVITATRAEDGCLLYAYSEDVLDAGLIRVSEKWESREKLAAHMTTPHMERWKVEREALGLTGRTITVYDVSGEQPL